MPLDPFRYSTRRIEQHLQRLHREAEIEQLLAQAATHSAWRDAAARQLIHLALVLSPRTFETVARRMLREPS